MSEVNYTISIDNPLTHQFIVSITYQPESKEFDEIYLPNWIPGSYMIRDFSKHILDLSASDEQGELSVVAKSKNRFHVFHKGQSVTINYKVHAFDLSVRKAYLDQQFGFINPASTCFAILGLEESACNVHLVKPTHHIMNRWQVATGLDKKNGTTNFDWGHYTIDGYLELTDYPILFGELDIAEFEVSSVPHYVVTVGQHFGDLTRVAKDLQPICQYHVDTFGELPNGVDQYLFMTMITDNGFGGLEHLNSTALVASRFDIIKEDAELTDDYQTFLSLCSHEYFHTWNVKRLKPAEFIPYKLDQEVYTQQLWFYEGMTSYFDDLSLVDTKTISVEKYLNTLAKTFTRLERGQGQLKQSVTESSFMTWTKFYQQDDTAPDQIVSYYLKGALIACFADLVIRRQSKGEHSLRDVMKTAWQKYGRTVLGTTQRDLESLFHTFMSEEDYQYFQTLLYKNEKANLVDLFDKFGLTLAYSNQDKSSEWFKPVISHTTTQKSQSQSIQVWLGAVLSKSNNQLVVKQVLADSPAQNAGIATGDVLVAFNQLKIDVENPEQWLNKVANKKSNLIHYFRKDALLCSDIELIPSPEFVAGFTINDEKKLQRWLATEV